MMHPTRPLTSERPGPQVTPGAGALVAANGAGRRMDQAEASRGPRLRVDGQYECPVDHEDLWGIPFLVGAVTVHGAG